MMNFEFFGVCCLSIYRFHTMPPVTNKTLPFTSHLVWTSRHQPCLKDPDHHHSSFLIINLSPYHLYITAFIISTIISSKKGQRGAKSTSFLCKRHEKLSKLKIADPVHQNICPALGTFVTPGPHPSHGGNPYSNEMQQIVIKMWQNGEDLQSPMITHLQGMKLFLHISTCRAWIQQFAQVGHVDSKKPTSNHRANHEITG